MPRRRMIDPIFWDDRKVGKLSRDERSLIAGCMGHADDDGRLQGDPAYLKATIFKYDDDLDNAAVRELRDSSLAKMQSWPSNHPYRMVLYSSSEEEYIFFPNFTATNRPSHPTKSQLPAPPPEALPIFSGKPQEPLTPPARETPESNAKPSALGQSSQGKVSIGQVSAVQEDFTKFLDNETDLTDFLTKTMTQYISAGRARALRLLGREPSKDEEISIRCNVGVSVLKKCWKDCVGEEIPGGIFEGAMVALKQYPLPVVIKAFARGAVYRGGKHKSWKYFQAIIDEELAKSRSP